MAGPRGVLLIGTGSRVGRYFIPAFRCLPDLYVLRGVHSRQRANVERVAGRWQIPPVLRLDDVDWSTIDMVAISVTIANVPQVLARLRRVAMGRTLFIDTPVLGRPQDLWALRLLRSFRTVVAEDFPRFPAHQVARGVLEHGGLGKIRSLRFVHCAYNHHGLALARSLLRLRFPVSIRVRSGVDAGLELRFGDGIEARIIEPYRREGGHFEIVGDNGVLTDRADLASRLPVHVIESHAVNEFRVGAAVRVAGRDHVCEASGLQTPDGQPFPDSSAFGLASVAGLVSLLCEAANPPPVPRYTALDAIHDYLAPGLSRRLGFLPDPLGLLPGRA